jgi:death-on-curing protein
VSDELPTPAEILATHEEIEEAYDLTHRGSRVAVPRLTLRELLEDVAEHAPDEVYLRAAHLLRDLVTGHLFEDGNKRTAWVTTREYLSRNDARPADADLAERVLKRIRRYDVEEIATWLETGEIDEDRLRP